MVIWLTTPALLASVNCVIERSPTQSSPAFWSCDSKFGHIETKQPQWTRKRKTDAHIFEVFVFVISAAGLPRTIKTVTLQQMEIGARLTNKETPSRVALVFGHDHRAGGKSGKKATTFERTTEKGCLGACVLSLQLLFPSDFQSS